MGWGLKGGWGIHRPSVLDDEAAVLDHVADVIHAQVVGQIFIPGHIAQDEVHLLAEGEAPHLVLHPNRAGAVDRGGVQRLLDAQADAGW